MALFKKNEPQPQQKPRERPMSSTRGQPDGAISIIGSGMKVVGDIATEGIVRVEGQVKGTIRAGAAVVLGQNGSIEGNVYTQDAVIGGRVSGSIVAENRLELQSTCTVDGEIRTRAEHLKLEEGARFAGQVQMIEAEAEAEPPVAQLPSGESQIGSRDAGQRSDSVVTSYAPIETLEPVADAELITEEDEESEEADRGGKDRKKAESR